jgi:hypothetical protein
VKNFCIERASVLPAVSSFSREWINQIARASRVATVVTPPPRAMPSHVLASSALSLSPRTALRASRRSPRAARVVVAAASSSADPATGKKHANATDDVVVVVDAAAAPRRRFLATALATALASSLASSGSSAIASTVFEGAYIDPNHPHCPRAVDANGVITGIDPVPFREGAGCRGYKKKNEARPISHWSPYDRVGVVNYIP